MSFLRRIFSPFTSDAALDVAPEASGEDRVADERALAGAVNTEPRWRQGFDAVEALMPDADDAIREEGPGVYLRMEQDPEIAAGLFQIDRRVLGRTLEWRTPLGMEADPFAVEVRDYVQAVTRAELDLRGDLRHLFRAKTRRLQVSQVVWRRGDGRHGEPLGTWVPDRLVAEDNAVFGRTRKGELYLDTGDRRTLLTPPRGTYDRKFIAHVHDPEPARPGGRSLLDGAYWSWKFLRAGAGFWMDLLDRLGVPSVVVLFEAASDDEKKAKAMADMLAGELASLRNGSSVALAAKDVETVDSGGRGADFKEFMTFLEKRMRKSILGTTLTVDIAEVGARAQGEVSEREVDGVAAWHGADLASTVERTLGRWAALMRFGDRARAVFPEAYFDWNEPATFEEYCKAVELGGRPSREALFTVYNVPRPANEGDEFEPPEARPAPVSGGLAFVDGRFRYAPFGRPRVGA